jgi:hypothetical protein
MWQLVELSDMTGLAVIQSGEQVLIVDRNAIKGVKKREK